MQNKTSFQYSLLALSIGTALMSAQARSQETTATALKDETEKIVVTATRRSATVQEAPVNVTVLVDDVMKDQNISELADIARWVPGLSVADQGGRSSSPIIVRGLNTNSSGPDSDGGTVATYVGEIPLGIDFDLIDMKRIEVLIGPQGTLYGAGTLGGAIRYIPNEVELDIITGSIFGNSFKGSQSDSLGGESGFIFNYPLIDDELGIRASFKYFNEPGFIDQRFLIQQPGVSLPDVDWNDASAVSSNLKTKKDTDGQDVLSGRVALRWLPTDSVDTTLTYFFQERKINGRNITHYNALAPVNPLGPQIGKYDSGYRYTEPADGDNELLSLEVKADLGFADLVSATGYSKGKTVGHRDHTDLLIRLDFGYEAFPAFTIFTREEDNVKAFNQELRLVSKIDGPLSWIGGYYHNKTEDWGSSAEYAPGYANFIGVNRPDDLEYLSVGRNVAKESAVFGELSYALSDKLDVTVGARFYKYDISANSAIALPFVNPDFDAAHPGQIAASAFQPIAANDDGNLFKFNTSYKITKDAMVYFTASEGFRIGGANGVAACPDPLPSNQIVCALPAEQLFKPDTTTNFELGFKSSWFKNKLYVNASIFDIDWEGAQVDGVTVNGLAPITTNAEGASSRGFELLLRGSLTHELQAYATVAYAKAELTADAPFLFGSNAAAGTEIQNYYDGKKGDRLPGAPENQVSVGVSYQTEVLHDWVLDVNYGVTYQSDVISKVGLRADGEKLPGFSVSNLTATLARDNWTISAYIDNLFDKYAYTSVRRDVGDIGQARFSQFNSNQSDILRNYGHYVLTPRRIGLGFSYDFEF